MSMRKILLGSLFAVVSGTAMAQQPVPADRAPGAAAPAEVAVPQPYRAKEVLGTKVSIQGGAAIGTVDDIVFGDDGQVDYVIVNDGGKMRTIPWDAAKFDFKQRTAVVNLSQQQIEVIPTYTVEQYPQFYTPAYRTQVYKWYNMTPAQQRRLERKVR